MHKQDYELIAKVFYEIRWDLLTGALDCDAREVIRIAIVRMADAFKAENERFDQDVFIDACYGVKKER